MPALEHQRHEWFCHSIARGNLPLISYIAAGYMRDEAAALSLMKQPLIAQRIAELQPHYDKKYRSRVHPKTILKKRRKDAENAGT